MRVGGRSHFAVGGVMDVTVFSALNWLRCECTNTERCVSEEAEWGAVRWALGRWEGWGPFRWGIHLALPVQVRHSHFRVPVKALGFTRDL